MSQNRKFEQGPIKKYPVRMSKGTLLCESSPSTSAIQSGALPSPPISAVSDAYGFEIKFEDDFHMAEYSKFCANYQKAMAVQKRAWEGLLSDPLAGSNQNEVKKLTRLGVPPELRARVWYECSGANTNHVPGLYEALVSREEKDQRTNSSENTTLRLISILEGDLFRTFPNNSHFSEGGFIDSDSFKNEYLVSLRRILVAFAYYSSPRKPEDQSRRCTYTIGYCQSINFIVGMLLLVFAYGEPHFDSIKESARRELEERVFWVFVVLIEKILPHEAYGNGLEGIHRDQEILWQFLLGRKDLQRRERWSDLIAQQDTLPAFTPGMDNKDDLRGESTCPSLSMITTEWLMTLFVNALPTETVLRVWDCLFLEGRVILIKVANTLLEMSEPDLFSVRDPSEAFSFLKDMPKRLIDCQKFMKSVFAMHKKPSSSKMVPAVLDGPVPGDEFPASNWSIEEQQQLKQ